MNDTVSQSRRNTDMYVPRPRCQECGKLIKVSKFGQRYCPYCGSLQLKPLLDKNTLNEGYLIIFSIFLFILIICIIIFS